MFNCGIFDWLVELFNVMLVYIWVSGVVNKLLMLYEMGELFKVIVIGCGIDEGLCGFVSGD